MSRLRFILPQEAGERTKGIFKKLVMVPNLFCIMANSEAVLDVYSCHHSHLGEYKLSPKLRKMISLAVSQFNACSYCIALHTSGAVSSGLLTPQECLDARRMTSPDPGAKAMLGFTRAVLENRGHVEDGTIEVMKCQGFDDREIIEAIAVIALINQANLTANVARPELDFPEPPALES